MQEVFEKIKVMLAEQYRKNRYESHNDEWNVGIDQAEQIVNEVVAEYNNGWIPCSERLPTMHECQENDCRFIVTDGNRRYQDWFDYEDNYFDRCSCDGKGLKKDDCVIAWQPLPAPYKPKED